MTPTSLQCPVRVSSPHYQNPYVLILCNSMSFDADMRVDSVYFQFCLAHYCLENLCFYQAIIISLNLPFSLDLENVENAMRFC